LKKGDKIVTLGGIVGTVHKVTNQSEISLEISEGVRIRILKTSIGDVLDKNSPLNKEESVDIQKVDKNKK